jgi:hypothetical protein
MTPKLIVEELARRAAESYYPPLEHEKFQRDVFYNSVMASFSPILTAALEVAEKGDAVEAAQIPHGGKNSNYPDGCECEQCEAWIGLKKSLSHLTQTLKEANLTEI